MSKLICSNLNRTLKLNNLIYLKLFTSHQVSRTLSFRSDANLLNNNNNFLNRMPIRFNSDKSDTKSDSKVDIKSDVETNTNETIEKRSTRKKSNIKKQFTWKRFGVSAFVCGIYFGFVYYLKKLKEEEWEKERVRSLGKAAIGGAFELVDGNNKPVTNKDFLGKWVLIYFGFTHCPDVCPEEIEKMVNVYHKVKAGKKADDIVPLFISVDPDRDTPEIVKKYCAEFSPHIVGLTGSKEQIKAMCKNYRVYYSPGPKSVDKDYIVDHTIIMYLINPDGEFVDYYGQTKDADMIKNAVLINMRKFKATKAGGFWFL